MMITKKGHVSEFMASLYLKEATYDAGVTMNNTNACSFKGYGVDIEWSDDYQTDSGELTGSEIVTDTEIQNNDVKIKYSEEKARVNSVLGFGALTLGAITSTQDGAVTAYRGKITPQAYGTALPSIQCESKVGGIQYAYKGIKGDSFRLSGEMNGYVKLECDMLGSGTRATSATAFAAIKTGAPENWLKFRKSRIWKEATTAISLDATLTQNAENISSGTPVELTNRIKSFSLEYNNANEKQFNNSDIDCGLRTNSCKMSVLFNDATELDHYVNQDNLAIELDLKNSATLIATNGTLYPGIHVVFPRCRIKKAPLPSGREKGTLLIDLELEILDDGTNDWVILEGYNAVAAYLA